MFLFCYKFVTFCYLWPHLFIQKQVILLRGRKSIHFSKIISSESVSRYAMKLSSIIFMHLVFNFLQVESF